MPGDKCAKVFTRKKTQLNLITLNSLQSDLAKNLLGSIFIILQYVAPTHTSPLIWMAGAVRPTGPFWKLLDPYKVELNEGNDINVNT